MRRNRHEAGNQGIAECRVQGARLPYCPRIELDRTQRLGRDRAVSPLIRLFQPGQANDVPAPKHLNSDPALARHEHVECDLTRVNEPELVSRTAFIEESVPTRQADIVCEVCQPVKVPGRKATQEWLSPKP